MVVTMRNASVKWRTAASFAVGRTGRSIVLRCLVGSPQTRTVRNPKDGAEARAAAALVSCDKRNLGSQFDLR